jgi:hypothetical protein
MFVCFGFKSSVINMIDSKELQFYYSCNCKSKRDSVCGACTIRLFTMAIKVWNIEKRMAEHKPNNIDKIVYRIIR